MSKEQIFDENTILVSKTDLKGNITYSNQDFLAISGFTEKELIGSPHNIVRNKNMPALIFKLLWKQLQNAEEINAYVLNSCKNGDYYWVYANVTPSFDHNNKVIGFHSTRRRPTKQALDIIIPLYQKLLQIEKSSGVEASHQELTSILNKKGVSYDEFIISC